MIRIRMSGDPGVHAGPSRHRYDRTGDERSVAARASSRLQISVTVHGVRPPATPPHARSAHLMIPGHSIAAAAALVLAIVLGTACSRVAEHPPSSEADTTGSLPMPLVADTMTIDHVGDLIRSPVYDPVPPDTALAARIRRGYHMFRSTKEFAPHLVGNRMSCGNCHLNVGQRYRGLPVVGVASTFPQFRSRSNSTVTLEGRICGCFSRSMNGPLPSEDAPEVGALAAYIRWLSDGIPAKRANTWRGLNEIDSAAKVPLAQLDTAWGHERFNVNCARCHGADGQGVQLERARPGPLWGDGSWNDGAGMGRVYTLAGFIRWAMPLDAPGTLTDLEAQSISAWINSHPRPVFPGKARDWPKGNVPVDAVYYPMQRRIR